MKNRIFKLSCAVAMLGALTACDDYLDVNRNIDAPDYVDDYLYLAGIEQAYYGIYYDIRATGPLSQMMGTTGYTNYAAHYYNESSDAAGQFWRTLYWDQGMNLENLMNQAKAAGKNHLVGIGLAIKAFSWDLATKYHGEMPMKEAYIPGKLSHSYDYQDEIYAQIRAWAYEAIEYLEMEDTTPYGVTVSANDYIYGGDVEKWKKFAYATIVRNLASLTRKNNFQSDYYQEMMDCAAKAFASNDDNATVTIGGGGEDAAFSAYNNFWGVYRGNLANTYFPSDYAATMMTGTIPVYDADGKRVAVPDNDSYPWELADNTINIICDTLEIKGHWDPRAQLKLGTADGDTLEYGTLEQIRKYRVYGGSRTGRTGSITSANNFYNNDTGWTVNVARCGSGRWLYRDDAPYILMTYPEILFDVAEAQFVCGNKQEAFDTWKKAIAADMEFSAKYITKASLVQIGDKVWHQGDKFTTALFNQAAQEYLDGPFVGGLALADFTLSHIMMHKFIALYPWGAHEAWVDQRKYHYDLSYTGDYPTNGNGYDQTSCNQKLDTDPTKVFKGYYLAPANVDGCRASYNLKNLGSPCYRVRPRYNSEYMWNKPSLEALKPISGRADNYQCSIPWFAYPGDMPKGNK